jgi:PRTRC genetic system protein A
MFVNHLYALEGYDLPPFGNYLFEYVTAGNGIFARARRPRLEALIPIFRWGDQIIRVLACPGPYVRLDSGPVPSHIVGQALEWMRQASPLELLTWIKCGEDGYCAVLPEHAATASRCQPVDPFDEDGQDALMDFHSHGLLGPFFSRTDDADERNGFRLCAVAGGFPLPALRVRVGVYGHFWDIPALMAIECPEGIGDSLAISS